MLKPILLLPRLLQGVPEKVSCPSRNAKGPVIMVFRRAAWSKLESQIWFSSSFQKCKERLFSAKKSRQSWSSAWQVAAAAIIFKMEVWWEARWEAMTKTAFTTSFMAFGVRSTKTKSTKSWNLQESSAPWNEKERHRPKASILWVPSISWESKGTSLVATPPPFKTILPP